MVEETGDEDLIGKSSSRHPNVKIKKEVVHK